MYVYIMTASLQSTLKHLYVINKKAKHFSNQSRQNHSNYNYEKSHRKSSQKDALYQVKYEVLQRIKQDVVDVEMHMINNTKHFYLKFPQEYGFHIPKSKITVEKPISAQKVLSDFSKSSKNELQITLKQALTFFNQEYNINANDFIQDSSNNWIYLY